MKNQIRAFLLAFSCIPFMWVTGCGPTRLAGGTETQNPEIVACVKKMAATVYDAENAGSAWQPSYYLQNASLGKKAGAGSSAPLIISDSRSDTVIMSDTIALIRDTAMIVRTFIKIDTIIVDKTLFSTDTVAETLSLASNGKTLRTIRVRAVKDSMVILDTMTLTDTILQQYQRVIVSVQGYNKEMKTAPVQIDTNWTALGPSYDNAGNNPSSADSRYFAPSPTWQIATVAYSKESSSLTYLLVSPPTKDSLVIKPEAPTIQTKTNALFISSKTFDDNILVESIGFDAVSSLLSIARFDPSLIDTVESLTVDYSVDLGANAYSGADDRLLSIQQGLLFRLGQIQRLGLILSPDPANNFGEAKIVNIAMVSMNIAYSGDKTGSLSGVLDADMRLIGIFETNGKKFQVSCDRFLTPHIVELTQ